MVTTHLKNAKLFTQLMDNQFPILGFSFGLDALIGIFPGLGDFISMCLSCYLVWIGVEMKLPPALLVQMIANIALDTVIGTIPLIGDIGDAFYKANVQNFRILENFAEQKYGGQVIEGEIVR